KNLKDIFFYQRAEKPGKPDVMILAQEATRIEVPNDAANVVDLVQGRRYEIYPGTPQYTQAEFASYRLRLENDEEAQFASAEVEALPTSQLWQNRQDPVVASELGWRVFVPFAILIALILRSEEHTSALQSRANL